MAKEEVLTRLEMEEVGPIKLVLHAVPHAHEFGREDICPRNKKLIRIDPTDLS